MPKLTKHAKRGRDPKPMHEGPSFYTACHHRTPTSTWQTTGFIRLQDDNGDARYSLSLSVADMRVIVSNFTIYLARHDAGETLEG